MRGTRAIASSIAEFVRCLADYAEKPHAQLMDFGLSSIAGPDEE